MASWHTPSLGIRQTKVDNQLSDASFIFFVAQPVVFSTPKSGNGNILYWPQLQKTESSSQREEGLPAKHKTL